MSSPECSPLTRRRPDEIIAINAGDRVSVARFLADACDLARRLPDHRYVINLEVDRYDYLLTFYAAVIAGQCTLMPPNRQEATIAGIRAAYPDSYTIGGRDERAPPATSGTDERFACPEIPADRLCAIAFTSGSTGTPQPNPKYWATLVGGGACSRNLLFGGMEETVNLVATVPPQHMWGFETSILMPAFADVAVCNRTPFFPQDFVAILSSVPEPRVLVSTPIHLQALLKSAVPAVGLARIYTATAPLSRELAVALEDRFDTEVTDVFGCTETGVLAVRRTSCDILWTLAEPFNLQCGEAGVTVSGAHLPEPVALPDIVDSTDGNRFRWIGRHQDMINIAGKRGSLSELNRALLAVPGVTDGVVFMPEGGNARLAALVVAPGVLASDILGYLKSRIEPLFLPRPLYHVDSLPRQETGKLPARAVQECFERLRGSSG